MAVSDNIGKKMKASKSFDGMKGTRRKECSKRQKKKIRRETSYETNGKARQRNVNSEPMTKRHGKGNM